MHAGLLVPVVKGTLVIEMRAFSSSTQPPALALPADGASLWARIELPFRATPNSPGGLAAAQSVLVRLDFASRKAEALVEFKPPRARAVANQLRGLLTQEGVPDNEGAHGFAYVAKRAIIAPGANVVHIESELNDAAEAWFTDQLIQASSALSPPSK